MYYFRYPAIFQSVVDICSKKQRGEQQMSEIQITKLVFGIFLSVGSAVLLLIAFKLYYKYLIQEKKCTAKTVGTVVRYTLATRGGENPPVCLPVIAYTVNGKTYKIVGPEYRGYKIVTKSTPWSENNYSCFEKNQVLYINRSMNSMFGFSPNPMAELYPEQSTVDVYYCPENPKLTYVLRYYNKKWSFWLTFLSACAVLVTDFLTLIVLYNTARKHIEESEKIQKRMRFVAATSD